MEEFKGKIGILGTGRTARAMAAYLMEKNCCPVMWGRNREALRKIREQGIVTLGCIEGHFYPQVQEDLKEVSGLCDYLFVMTTSQGHRDLAKSLKGLLKQDQRILIFNGNWGAYEFFEELEEEIEEKQAVIGETGGMIFIADYDGEACRIKSIKNRMSAAAFPCDYGEVLVQELEPVLPQLKAEANVLVTSINNSNPVIHVPLAMTNFTRIENGEDFLFYGEGATVSSVHYIEEIDREREAAARALGVELDVYKRQFTSYAADGWAKTNDQWVYVNQGKNHTGWLQTSDGWYYMDLSTGYMSKGFKQIDGKWYFFKPSGVMATGWINPEYGKWYYMLDDGTMVTGWLKIKNGSGYDYYFMRGNGTMATGWREMDKAWYYFQSNGKCVVNSWAQIKDNWYLFGADGKMMTGWAKVDKNYFYLNTDGRMLTGWLNDSEGNKYYMDTGNGAMATGWKQIDNSWYYFNSNGHMMTGWIQLNGKYYYLNPADSGKMIAGRTANINGTDYTFDASGVCQNASGVSAQNPTETTPGGSGVSGENGGPGVSGGSSGISSNGPGSSNSGSSPSGSGNQSPSTSPGGSADSGSLQPGRTDGPG